MSLGRGDGRSVRRGQGNRRRLVVHRGRNARESGRDREGGPDVQQRRDPRDHDVRMMATPELPEHWFRRELGRLVSILSRRFGHHRLELCEDAAQSALLRATQSWSSNLPDDPGAWLYRVAHNYVLDELRREKRDERYLAEVQV